MKTLARSLTTVLLALTLALPQAFADNPRTSGNRGGNRREQPAAVNHRPSADRHRGPKHQNTRPTDRHDKKQFGNSHHNNYNQPDNRWPGNNHYNKPDNRRPHQGHDRYRYPDRNHHYNRPVHNAGYGPGHHPHHPPMMRPPHRPYRPVPGPWHRPVRPYNWCPAPHAPTLSTMLGVAFGTAINLAINQLINSGYNVSGYNSNTIYLTDVNQAGYFWPDATFYYNGGGCLDRSQFYYTSPYNDCSRYGALYNAFTARYGYPVNVINSPANMSATWFAPDRGYITLQFGPGAAMSLPGRFVTTLTVGI